MKTAKIINRVFAALAVCLASLVGCKKQDAGGPPQEYYGLKVDWPKLSTAFTNATPELQASVSLLLRDFRYAQFAKALAELERLSNDSSLTAPQKKLLNDLTEQTKQVIAKGPPQPEQ